MKSFTPILLLGALTLIGAGNAGTPVTHEVTMRQDGDHYVFQPAALKIRSGDVVRFTNISGGPHNIAFDSTGMTETGRKQLYTGMKDQLAPLAGPLLTAEKQSYEVSFEGAPAGEYPFYCMPHVALGMKGIITVE